VSPRIAPGWYPDPAGEAVQRWWNGSVWSEQVRQEPAPAAPHAGPPTGSGDTTSRPAAAAAPTAMRPAVPQEPSTAAAGAEVRGGGRVPVRAAVAVVPAVLAAVLAFGWLYVDGPLGGGSAEAEDRGETMPGSTTEVTASEEQLTDRDAEIAQLEEELASSEELVADLEGELEQLRGELDAATGRQRASGIGNEILVGELRFSEIDVRPDSVEDFQIRARMTNEWSRSFGDVSITATIFDEGGRILGELTGHHAGIDAGASSTVTLTGVDDYVPDWDSLEIRVAYE
jgi:hypothetical protein